MSSEIGLFEHKQADFLKILDFAQIPYVIYIGNLSKIKDFHRIFGKIRLLVFKWIDLGAQEELVGQTVIGV